MKFNKTLWVYLDEKQMEKFENYCRDHSKKKTEAIRDILEEFLEKEPKRLEYIDDRIEYWLLDKIERAASKGKKNL